MRCLTHGWIDGPEANPQKPGSAGTAQRSSNPTLATEDTSVLYEGEGMAGGPGGGVPLPWRQARAIELRASRGDRGASGSRCRGRGSVSPDVLAHEYEGR